MRWHKSDEVPKNRAECLCKCKRGTEDTELKVLKAHVHRDSSGEVQIFVWYDEAEGECFGDWEPGEVLYWCSLEEIDSALTASNG